MVWASVQPAEPRFGFLKGAEIRYTQVDSYVRPGFTEMSFFVQGQHEIVLNVVSNELSNWSRHGDPNSVEFARGSEEVTVVTWDFDGFTHILYRRKAEGADVLRSVRSTIDSWH